MKYSQEDVLKFLPHREPFLFVDQIDAIELPEGVDASELELNDYRSLTGLKIKGSFEIKADLEILRGHFPGNPIFPGVAQIEMMAQVSAFSGSVFIDGQFDEYRMEVLFSNIDKVKFRKVVKLGMKLDIEAVLLKARHTFQVFELKCFHDGESVSEATVMASLKIVKN